MVNDESRWPCGVFNAPDWRPISMMLEWNGDRAQGIGGAYAISVMPDGITRVDFSPLDTRIREMQRNQAAFVADAKPSPLERCREEAQRWEDRIDHECHDGWWSRGRCVHVIGYGARPSDRQFGSIVCGSSCAQSAPSYSDGKG